MRRFVALALLTTLSGFAAAQNQTSTSYLVKNLSITGLYDSAGAAISGASAIKLNNASYEMSYRAQNVSGTTTYYYHHLNGSGKKIWPLKIKLNFNSSSWTSYPTATIGIQICGYKFTTPTGSTVTNVSAPYDYFQLPTTTILSGTSGSYPFTFSVVPGDVNPRIFTLSQFSVDPANPAGTTAILDLAVEEGQPATGGGFPWDKTPVTGRAVSGSTTYGGVIWIFPRVSEDGFCSYQATPEMRPYDYAP